MATTPVQGVFQPVRAQATERERERWYALYTCARREKRVAEQLATKGVEHFLPLYTAVRRWKTGRIELQLPLFPGYVLVRQAFRDRLSALQVPGVVRLVGFGSGAEPLDDDEVEALQKGLSTGAAAEPYPFLTVGRGIQVRSGPFQGLEGKLIRRKGRSRLVISLDLIMRSIVVDIDVADIESAAPVPRK
jgi:transcription antitermination factor NusG